MNEKKSFFCTKILVLFIFTVFSFFACTPAYIKRLEKIENLLDNLEKEIKITKTSPELATIHTNVNAFSMEIEKISSLEYSGTDTYSTNAESLSNIISRITSIQNELKATESEQLDDELKTAFLSSSGNILSFADALKNRDISISKGESDYKKAEENMLSANEALKNGKRDEAEFNLKSGREALNSGNMEFVKASAINNSLLEKREELINNYNRFVSLVREKLGLELFEMSQFKFLDKDKKRLERTVDNLKGKK